jgi:UPF0755 protein
MGLHHLMFRMSATHKTVSALMVMAVAVIATAAAFYYWAHAPLTLNPAQLDVTIKPRSSLKSVARQLHDGGVPVQPQLFVLLTRLLGQSAQLKSGNYAFKSGVNPAQVLQKLVRGDVNEYVATIVEGWTFKRMRAELDQNPALRHDTAGLSDQQLLALLGEPNQAAEGLFFPDTYLFDKDTSDLEIYRRAWRLARVQLDQAWAARAPGLPYSTPYQALIAASMIEKETGHAEDRALVSAVFVNRLKLGMPLQTDPTVIYGMGERYQGKLRRVDLQTDTPYNTYTRVGLPPTPISLPGAAALLAATNPAISRALYFVSRGDGSSAFSDNLDEHNKAVNKYIRAVEPHQ